MRMTETVSEEWLLLRNLRTKQAVHKTFLYPVAGSYSSSARIAEWKEKFGWITPDKPVIACQSLSESLRGC